MPRTMNGLTLYRVTYRESARSRKVRVWERWATDIDAATESAKQALAQEYDSAAVLLSVEEVA